MKPKIAMLFPYAPSYREPVYQLMDREFDIDWFFCGDASRKLKMFNYSLLKHCDLSMSEVRIAGPLTYYRGLDRLHLEKYDIIVIAGVMKCLSEWLIPLRYSRPGVRIFCWTHGWYGKEGWLRRQIKKIYFRQVDGLLLYGEYAKRLLMKEGFPECKLHLIMNSLDYGKQLELRKKLCPSDIYRNHFGNSDSVIIFIGRLTREKRLDMLIRAVADLKERGEKYNLAFVGAGDVRDDLARLADESGLGNAVWFYGECFDEASNAELIFNASLCVSPGSVGLTAIHALTFGCPVITHDNFKLQGPEFESVKPGVTGDFFRFNDCDDLAGTISSWFKNHKDSAEQVRAACYEEIECRWNPDRQIAVLKTIFGQ